MIELDLEPLPEDYITLEATAVFKCLDDEGETVLVTRSTDSLATWDKVGMLTVALDGARDVMRNSFVPDADDDEDSE